MTDNDRSERATRSRAEAMATLERTASAETPPDEDPLDRWERQRRRSAEPEPEPVAPGDRLTDAQREARWQAHLEARLAEERGHIYEVIGEAMGEDSSELLRELKNLRQEVADLRQLVKGDLRNSSGPSDPQPPVRALN
jgi:hypothetical protein